MADKPTTEGGVWGSYVEYLGALENELKAAQATIRTLTTVVEQAEALVEERDRVIAANRAAAIEHAERHQALLDEWLRERAHLVDRVEALRSERDEAVAAADRSSDELHDLLLERNRLADELAQTRATVVRLACHRVGLHNCDGEWKNHDHAEDRPDSHIGSGLNSGGED